MGSEASYWLLKTEPQTYSFAKLTTERKTTWTGIRNYQARNFMRAMKPGDWALIFHTGDEKAVVGVAKVVSSPGPDPTAPREDWAAVDLAAHESLVEPVSLERLKHTASLRDLALLKQSRLSVSPLRAKEFNAILKLGQTRL